MKKNFIVFDAHCDTAAVMLDSEVNLCKNTGHVDLDRMLKYKGYIQCFAAFVSPEFNPKNSFKRANDILSNFIRLSNAHKSHIKVCTRKNDVIDAINCGKVAAILTIEGGEALDDKVSNVDYFADMGVKAISMTWNNNNNLANGADDETGIKRFSGVSELGVAVIRQMNKRNVLLDVSHLVEESFWAATKISTQPIIATHSNAKAVYADKHNRNITDDQFLAIVKSGGCVGINLFSEFLGDGNVNVSTVMAHIEHFLSLGGENHIGMGSDFDGIDAWPEDICGVQDVCKIFEQMHRSGYSNELIEKIAYKNFVKIFGFEHI